MFVILALLVIAGSFVAGSLYGRRAEQKAIAEIVRTYDYSAAKAISFISLVRARVALHL